jgi:SP family arabinose:H+ symporter-like MFS transporter
LFVSSSIKNQVQHVSMKFVTLVSMVAALGGLLFGFDTAVVSGAIGFMKERFILNEVEVGGAVSSLIIGCIIGARVPVC